jgi:hypothetical protein
MRSVIACAAVLACALTIACGRSPAGRSSESDPVQPDPSTSTSSGGSSEADEGPAPAKKKTPSAGSGADESVGAGPRKRIFVTSMAYAGNLGGSGGADALCQAVADAAVLSGTFVAFVPSDTADAIDRVGDGPWYSADRSTLLFTGKAKGSHPLDGGGPAAPIALDENLQPFTYATYWTGSQQDGTRSAWSCGSFSLADPNSAGDYGAAGASISAQDGSWIRYRPGFPAGCEEAHHVLCFEK